MVIQNKQDVINWLKRLKEEHPLSIAQARKRDREIIIDGSNNRIAQDKMGDKVVVYTDQIIKDRYEGLIDYLESDEVA